MENNNDLSESSRAPKWSDYPGLAEHVAADIAKMTVLPDTEIKAKTLAQLTLDQTGMEEAYNSLRNTHPERAAVMLGISVEEVKNLSAESLIEMERQRIEQMSPEELRKEFFDGQKHFNSLSGGQDAGDSNI